MTGSANEQKWLDGYRAAWRRLLGECLHELGTGGEVDPQVETGRLVAELEDVRRQLRSLCEEFGDNDWPDEMHLGDAIARLGKHLRAARAGRSKP